MSIEIIFEEESNLSDPSTDTFDLAECCRTCLQPECSLTPTNSFDSDSIKFCDKLAACISGMKWPKERVLSFICGICIEKLRIAYDFRTVCLGSDRALQLQEEANEIQSCRSAAADPTTTTDIARCDKITGNVILSTNSVETQTDPSLQYSPIIMATIQLEDNSCKPDCQACGKESCEHIQGHPGEKSHQCLVCLKQFMVTAELIAHMQIHIEDKWYACNFCEKRYVNAAKLQAHIHSHTGEKLFACRHCDKRFLRKYLLNSHLRTHIGEKRCICKICSKSCRNSSVLARHMKTHSGKKYSCKLCDKKFTWSRSLDLHMQIHTGDKTWRCKICGKSYTASGSLLKHMKTHTGEEFSCMLCRQEFKYSLQLTVHMQGHMEKITS